MQTDTGHGNKIKYLLALFDNHTNEIKLTGNHVLYKFGCVTVITVALQQIFPLGSIFSLVTLKSLFLIELIQNSAPI